MASSSSKLGSNITDNSITDASFYVNMPEKDLNFYLPLYKAAIQGDWKSASIFFDSNPDAITARITKILETVLHIAVGRSEAIHFVEKLVELMPVEALPLTSKFSETAVHYAAKYGNIKAAKLLVARDPGLPHIWSDTNLLPLHLAALFGHKEMVSFLLTVTKDNIEPNPFADKPGITLLISIVYSGFYDVALDLVQRYPKLAVTISPGGNTALSILAGKPSAFLSGCSLGFWQKFIYSCVPVKLAKISHRQSRNDIENLSEPTPKHIDKCCRFLIQNFRKEYLLFACQKLHKKFWELIQAIVPQVKHIYDTKLMHYQAIELVKFLCMEIPHTDNSTSGSIYKPAVITAATLGHYEVLEEILKAFPSAIWSLDKEKHDLFQMAVINRRETIFNLLYELDEHAHLVTKNTDIHDNNILHLAGKMAPPHRLNLLAGAALQMQRELQWYKEVQNFVTPSYKGKENSDGKTPAIVFTEEHKDLITKGEQWLKETAKSCTFAGTLIATVVFAAAITVPGGSSSKSGIPIFHKETPFLVFAISNAEHSPLRLCIIESYQLNNQIVN
ncbi:Ankyrin repeat family protein [Forsythia ovata]|uniref:Ankyrin repeat family protein n=1 Tax=Forsythia ovata TaxID=205694 RepID=A0ABD1WVN1_9LAMI